MRPYSFLTLVVGLLSSSGASAEDGDRPWFHETLEAKLAAVFTLTDSDLKIPPEIDLEGDLDVDDFVVQPTASLAWRFTENRRHRLGLTYFALLRSGKKRIDFDLDLPRVTIPAGVQTKTDLDIHIASLVYEYSFLHDRRKELGVFLGLDLIYFDGELKAQVLGTPVRGKLADDDVGIPFPTGGAFLNWAFAERFALFTRFQAFGLEVGNVSGALFKGDLRVEHDTFEYLNLFLGYQLLGATASVDGSFDDFTFFSHGPSVGFVLRY